MARPKGKPYQDGKPDVEMLRTTVGADRVKAPRTEFIIGAISGILAHPHTKNAALLSEYEWKSVMATAFDLAEAAQDEHQRRYG